MVVLEGRGARGSRASFALHAVARTSAAPGGPPPSRSPWRRRRSWRAPPGSRCWPPRSRPGCSPRGTCRRSPARPRGRGPGAARTASRPPRSRPRSRSRRRRPCPWGRGRGGRSSRSVCPVFLSTATRPASRAPGVKIRRSPSTSGDSLHFQHGHHGAAEVPGQALAPALLAGGRLQADEVALGADGVEQVAVDGGGAAAAPVLVVPGRADLGAPDELAVGALRGRAPAARRPCRRWCRRGRRPRPR